MTVDGTSQGLKLIQFVQSIVDVAGVAVGSVRAFVAVTGVIVWFVTIIIVVDVVLPRL